MGSNLEVSLSPSLQKDENGVGCRIECTYAYLNIATVSDKIQILVPYAEDVLCLFRRGSLVSVSC
jgi:hypothetical protein